MPPLARRAIVTLPAHLPSSDIEKVLSRLAQSSAEDRLIRFVESVPPGDRTRYLKPRRALDALLAPDSPKFLAAAEDLARANGLSIGGIIGAGMESLVLDAVPKHGPDRHVLKIAVDAGKRGLPMTAPEDVPGVVPYWAKRNVGPSWAGLQEKADVVYPGTDRPYDVARGWEKIADRLNESLMDRGYFWSDNIPHNMGLMPGGRWSVIDGEVRRMLPAEEDGLMGAFVDSAAEGMFRNAEGRVVPRGTKMTEEQAIKVLQATPEDLDLIRRTPFR